MIRNTSGKACDACRRRKLKVVITKHMKFALANKPLDSAQEP